MKYKEYINKKHSFDKLTMLGVLSLIIVISGIFGFIYEYIFYYFNSGMKTFYWRGYTFIPWLNIYAIGGLLIYFLCYRYRKSILKVFVLSTLSCGILEFISGLILYIIGKGARYWDYNTEILNFGNIYGFVCLRSVLFFGFSGLLLIYIVIPLLFKIANKINKKIFLIISVSLCSIILLDEFYNLLLADILNMPKAVDIYTQLGIKYMKY